MGVQLPPLGPLREICARLEGAGHAVALGGSGLLARHGLAERVRDWDLTTDAALADAQAALGPLDWDVIGPNGIYATRYMLRIRHRGAELDLMGSFALKHAGGTFAVPTRVTERWNGVPVGCPAAWAVAYALLGREAKADALFAWLGREGADAGVVAALCAQPLPERVAVRLRGNAE